MKKVVILFYICLISIPISAKSINLHFLSGTWMPENELTSDVRIQLYYDQFYPNDSSFDFIQFEKNTDYIGILKYSGLSFGYLIKDCSEKDNKYVFECYLGSLSDITIDSTKVIVTISILGEDWIQIDGLPQDKLLSKSNKLYRSEDARNEPLHRAVVNDSSVRLRTEPSLKSHTMYLLPENYEVEILEKSKEVTEINGEKWPWYKIRSIYCVDGWIYGKYLDIDNTFIQDEKTIELNDFIIRKDNKCYYFAETEFYYVSKNLLSSEELKEILIKENYTEKTLISTLNSKYTNYHFSKIKWPFKILTNEELFRELYFRYSQNENNLRATEKGKVEFNNREKTIKISANVYSRNFGIKIGMSKEQLLSILGNPSTVNKNELIYRVENFGLFTFTFKFDEKEQLELYVCQFTHKI